MRYIVKINIHLKKVHIMKKVSLTILISLILSSMIIFEGCVATIFSTTKQSTRIFSTPNGATVYVNDKESGKTPTKVRLKRKKNSEIKIEKEGYKTHNEILYPAKINPVAYISILFVFYPYYVDMLTGAALRLNKKELKPKLIKIPNKIEKSETVVCSEVNLKYKAGDKMGNIIVKGEPTDIIYFGKTVDFDAYNYKDNVNTALKELGFSAVKTEKGILSGNPQVKYTIVADVKDIKYNIVIASKWTQGKGETKCEMTTNWKILNRNKEVKFEKTTKGESVKFENGGTAAIFDAFENSFYEFMYNKEPYEILKKTENTEIANTFNEITIDKPINKVQDDKLINNATKGVVTLETGDGGHGSGSLISSDGYIVTNFHVIEGVNKVKVVFKDGVSLDGNVLRFDEEADLALVKVSGSGFNPLILSTDKEVNVGSDVYAIGTPANAELSQTVTKGIISGERKVENSTFIQTDGSVNAGCSGGALIDKTGVIIGIINAKIFGKGIEGLGFAIPAYKVFEKLKIKYSEPINTTKNTNTNSSPNTNNKKGNKK